jgi:hypothetical protein
MSDQIDLAYDAGKRRAVLTFPNGRTLAVGNVTEEQARAFKDKHGAEFQRRDCVLHTGGEMLTREANG